MSSMLESLSTSGSSDFFSDFFSESDSCMYESDEPVEDLECESRDAALAALHRLSGEGRIVKRLRKKTDRSLSPLKQSGSRRKRTDCYVDLTDMKEFVPLSNYNSLKSEMKRLESDFKLLECERRLKQKKKKACKEDDPKMKEDYLKIKKEKKLWQSERKALEKQDADLKAMERKMEGYRWMANMLSAYVDKIHEGDEEALQNQRAKFFTELQQRYGKKVM